MKALFKILLTVDTIVLLLAVYMIKSLTWIPGMGRYSVVIYLTIPFVLAIICVRFSEKLSKDSIEGGIKGIELANDSFLPSYIGYFFVALSIPDKQYITLSVVFGMLFVFLICSQNLYYNPLFLMLGYRFYYLTNAKDMKIFLITKKNIKSGKELQFNNLRRINYFTFIDREIK